MRVQGSQPLQGRWNFDAEDRSAFPKSGPGKVHGRVKYHLHISVALKVKLLYPREVIKAALTGVDEGRAPIEAVEGVVRQVIGRH